MTDVGARALELVAVLKAAGLQATADPGKVDALMRPRGDVGAGCVLVVPLPLFTQAVTCGDWLTTWTIVAMAPRNKGQIPATRLVSMVELVVDALPVTEARPSTYALEQGQTGYPAYTMTLED